MEWYQCKDKHRSVENNIISNIHAYMVNWFSAKDGKDGERIVFSTVMLEQLDTDVQKKEKEENNLKSYPVFIQLTQNGS